MHAAFRRGNLTEKHQLRKLGVGAILKWILK
jgi:hypothetical protein